MSFGATILWHKKTAFLFPYEGISKRRLYGVLFTCFYDSKGRQHFRLSLLDPLSAKQGGAVNGDPVHLDR